MNKHNYNDLVKLLRYELSREELETVKRTLDKDKEYTFTKTSCFSTIKELFVDIKDTFRGRDLFISLFRKSNNIINLDNSSPGFINRYEIEWGTDNINFIRRESTINNKNIRYLIHNIDSHRENDKNYVVENITLYKPIRFY